jgi:hypothetical protein
MSTIPEAVVNVTKATTKVIEALALLDKANLEPLGYEAHGRHILAEILLTSAYGNLSGVPDIYAKKMAGSDQLSLFGQDSPIDRALVYRDGQTLMAKIAAAFDDRLKAELDDTGRGDFEQSDLGVLDPDGDGLAKTIHKLFFAKVKTKNDAWEALKLKFSRKEIDETIQAMINLGELVAAGEEGADTYTTQAYDLRCNVNEWMLFDPDLKNDGWIFPADFSKAFAFCNIDEQPKFLEDVADIMDGVSMPSSVEISRQLAEFGTVNGELDFQPLDVAHALCWLVAEGLVFVIGAALPELEPGDDNFRGARFCHTMHVALDDLNGSDVLSMWLALSGEAGRDMLAEADGEIEDAELRSYVTVIRNGYSVVDVMTEAGKPLTSSKIRAALKQEAKERKEEDDGSHERFEMTAAESTPAVELMVKLGLIEYDDMGKTYSVRQQTTEEGEEAS